MAKFWRLPICAATFLLATALVCLQSRFMVIVQFVALTALIMAAIWRSRFFMAVCLGLSIAWLRFDLASARINDVERHLGHEEPLRALILRREQPQTDVQKLTLKILSASAPVGKTTAEVPSFPVYAEGQTVEIDCRWTVPTKRDDVASVRNRYTKGLYLGCAVSKVKLVDVPLSCWRHPLICFHRAMIGRINELWPRPERSLVQGILLGDKADFPKQTLQEFSAAGISHIIALSGFNITIIIVSLEAVALRLCITKRWRFVVVLTLITLFTVFVGSASSIVRAAGMGALAILGKTFGRRPSAPRLLLISAAMMTLTNPFTLLYDVGFQLSCLATFGLLAFSEWFEKRLWFIPQRLGLRGSLATTLAASTPTLPLLGYQFGTLSVIAPLTNMLILPLIPHLMWISGLALLLSVVFAPIAQLVAWIVNAGCRYILVVSAWAASIPWATKPLEISAVLGVTLTAATIILGYYAQKNR